MAKHYINNKDFMREILAYHKSGKISTNLHNMIHELAKRIVRKPYFMSHKATKSAGNYDLIEDLITEGYLKCITKIDSFDHINNKNPFAYFTSIIYNAFRDFLYKEFKQKILKQRCQEEYDFRFYVKFGVKRCQMIEENS